MTRMDDRHRTDAVTIGDTRTLRTTSRGRLAHLGDLAHVQIADGEPDLRGWEVKGPAGRRVGTVSDLLVDTGAMKVRYLEVELDPPTAREMAHASGDTDPRIKASRHALVPIGIARLDQRHERVYLGAGAAQLIGLPEPEGRDLTREYERALVRWYGVDERARAGDGADGGQDDLSSDRFYEQPYFDEHACFGPRRRAGESSFYIIPANSTNVAMS